MSTRHGLLDSLLPPDPDDYDRGQAAGYLIKAGNVPKTVHPLVGRLYFSKSGWILLSVPNAVVRGLFDALGELGAELPRDGDGELTAHVSVIRKEELEALGGPDKISERGHEFHFGLGPIKEVQPAGWSEMSKVWFVSVRSPELTKLRRSYGLPDQPTRNGKPLPFHLTIGVRKRRVLSSDPVSKAASVRNTLVVCREFLRVLGNDVFESAAKTAETTHVHTDARGTYDVSALFKLLEGRPVETVPIDQLKGLSRSRRDGFSPVSRLPYADTGFPILVESDNKLFDGRHRALKLLAAGKTHAQARRVRPGDLAAVKQAASMNTLALCLSLLRVCGSSSLVA